MIELAQSEEAQLLQAAVARFFDAEYPGEAIRALLGSSSGIPTGYFREIGELGWLSLLVGEAETPGVADQGVSFSAIVAEERGRRIQPGPFTSTSVAIAALCRNGSQDQRARILPALTAGEHLAAWAVTDLTGTFAPEVALTARADGSRVVVAGEALVQDAGVADWFLVTVGGPAGLSQLLVPRSVATHVVDRDGFDVTLRFGVVRFDNVDVPADYLVGPLGGGSDDVEWQLQLAATLTCAETVGAMDALFEMTRRYALDRFAFGRPIGSFQAVKHQLADISMLLESARAVTATAVEAVEAGRPAAGEIVSIAKAWVADAGIDVAQGCAQVFGGIGQTWEHDSHLFLRRITMNALLYGDAAWHRERICRMHGL